MDATPDLSHLTEDERKIIEAVINRQQAEDKLDASTIQSRPSVHSMANSHRRYSQCHESGALCQICQKTKFVDEQSSRQCSICRKRFCVRCGIRLKCQYYLCNECRQKQEYYFSSKKNNFSKQYVSDYLISHTSEHGPKRVLPRAKANDEDVPASPRSLATCDQHRRRLLPEIKQHPRSIKMLRDFQYHSLEEKESAQESTLKDSGIDTASSSTIINAIPGDPSKKPVTYWRTNERRTEDIGYIYLKNSLAADDYEQNTILEALGLSIDAGVECDDEAYMTEITEVQPGSAADTYGQLCAGDRILEWNGEKLSRLDADHVHRVISQTPINSSHIYLIVKRLRSQSTGSTIDYSASKPICQDSWSDSPRTPKNGIQLQLSFQYDHRELHVMIHGARHIPLEQGLLACQLSLQHERDALSKEDKCTKARACSANSCSWNQPIRFFDIDSIESMALSIKLVDLDHHEDVLGEIHFARLDLHEPCAWYDLNGTPSAPTDNCASGNNRKRQLPHIPSDQLNIHREKVSQDLFEKATLLKLRLHLQSTNDKALITQHSFDQATSVDRQLVDDAKARKSMINLSSAKISSSIDAKDKRRIPMIRNKTASPPTATQRRISMEKMPMRSLEEKRRSTMRKRDSSETPSEDVDSDGSELSNASKISSLSMLSTQSERPRTTRKPGIHRPVLDYHPFARETELHLNDEELRQMATRTHETSTSSAQARQETTAKIVPSATPDKISNADGTKKLDQRTDGTQSDSALSAPTELNKKRRPSMSSKALVILGLSKNANSASNLGKRYGFQRSEEIGVQHHLRNRTLPRQTSKENETPPANASQPPSGLSPSRVPCHSIPDNMKLWSGALNLPHERQFADFIEGLGTGQLVGRQVLASPCHGEIQIGLRDQQGQLEIEIVRARNLLQKIVYKTPPAPYVKVYLLDGKTCLEKQRTRTTRRTLDPLIQQTLIFRENYRQKVLQISVWGDYSKLDRKVFLGVCQISLAEMNLNSSQQILDWYKLFSTNSLMNTYSVAQTSLHRRNSLAANAPSPSLKTISRF